MERRSLVDIMAVILTFQ